MATSINLVGVLTVGPESPVMAGPVSAPSLQPAVNIGLSRTASKHQAGRFTVAGTVSLPTPGFTGVTFFFARVLSGGLELDFTSALGTSQRLPISGALLIDSPATPLITAISVVGTGEIEYIVAGV